MKTKNSNPGAYHRGFVHHDQGHDQDHDLDHDLDHDENVIRLYYQTGA